MESVERMCSLLDAFNVPYFRQGSAPQDVTLPPTFFTYWHVGAIPEMHYDNCRHARTDTFSIIIYTKDVQELAKLDRFAEALTADGWGVPELPVDYPAWNEYYSKGIRANRLTN